MESDQGSEKVPITKEIMLQNSFQEAENSSDNKKEDLLTFSGIKQEIGMLHSMVKIEPETNNFEAEYPPELVDPLELRNIGKNECILESSLTIHDTSLNEKAKHMDTTYATTSTTLVREVKLEPGTEELETENWYQYHGKLADENKMESEIVPRHAEFFCAPETTLIKFEARDESNHYKSAHGIFEDPKIKNEELDIKEEVMERNETSTSSCFSRKDRRGYTTLRYKGHMWQGSGIRRKRKNKFTRVLIIRKNSEKVEAFKCNECNYLTASEDNLDSHIREHFEEANGFKCDQYTFLEPSDCDIYKYSYLTTDRNKLEQHSGMHEKSEATNLLKCSQCSYQTCYERTFKLHILKHKNPDEGGVFHHFQHNQEETDVFTCVLCNFQTNCKNSFKLHIFKHQNPEKVVWFKCDQCSFRTKLKRHLKRHSMGHKKSEESEMFKCNVCFYKTIYKNGLKRHLRTHEDYDKADTFKCDQCNFQSNRKYALAKHIQLHNKFK